MKTKEIKIGIIGGTGIVAGELIRCLQHHPYAQVDFVYSHSKPDAKFSDIHQDLEGDTDLTFTQKINKNVEVIFLCLGHGKSKHFLENNPMPESMKIIDLSNDFRLSGDEVFQNKKFVYGLVDLNKKQIKSAKYIANPGCFATAIQLALLPLAEEGLLTDEVHVHAVTGSTGAGNSLSDTTHFTWRNNNISLYQEFSHQHLGEIKQSVNQLQSGFNKSINFLPMRGNFTRGIFASVYLNCTTDKEKVVELFKNFYKDSVFTKVSDKEIHLKQVVNSNKALIHVKKIDGKILVTSAIDNLLKGAAGQAIENMNLMQELPQNTGLQFKANYY